MCRRPGREALRREWGCDHEVDGWQFDCFACPERDPDPACLVCAGTGTWTLRRCPNAFIDPDHRRIPTCAAMLEVGVLPISGGWHDQTVWAREAIQLALAEKRGYEERRVTHGGV